MTLSIKTQILKKTKNRDQKPQPKNKKDLQENPESLSIIWSGRLDLNQRPLVPQTSALPDCATPRAANKNKASFTTLSKKCQALFLDRS